MKKNALLFALVLSIGCSGLRLGLKQPHSEGPKLKLDDHVIPHRYELTLWATDDDAFSGKVAIDIELKKDSKSILIHSQDLKIFFVDLLQGEKIFKGQFIQVDQDGLGRIDFAEKLPKGHYQLQVSYNGKYRDDLSGLYRVKEGDQTYLFTQFEPLAARQMLPCFDEPRWKTPFLVTVVSKIDQVVVANSPLVKSHSQGDKEVHIFEPTKPIPTYLLALAIGPFDVVEGEAISENEYRKDKIALRGIAAKGKGEKLRFALKETPAILHSLEENFGIGYPFGKLDIVAVPDFSYGAMENVGLITFRDWLLLLDEKAPVDQIKRFYEVMAHELSHQWFGNLVTMPWWDDLWLNESFATWKSHTTVKQLKPEFRSADLLLSSQAAMAQDSLRSARKIHEPINSNHDIHNAFDHITYLKGGAVLSMLENYLSPKVFQEAVSTHINRFSYGTATSSDFLMSLASRSDPALVKSAKSFLNHSGFPLVTMSYSCGPKGFVIKAMQERYIPLGGEAEKDHLWGIPLCLGYGSSSEIKKHCFIMDKKTYQHEIRSDGCPEVIIPNFLGQGYYRFSLSLLDWAELVRNASGLEEGHRMAIADSLIGELYAGRLDFEFVLDSLRQFIDINSSAVTGYFMDVFKESENYWMSDANRASFLAFGRDAIKPIYEELKGKSDLSIDQRALRRSSATFLATIIKDPKVRAELVPVGKDYLAKLLKDQELTRDASLEDMLPLSLSVAMQDDPKILSEIVKKLVKITDTSVRRHILQALAQSKEGNEGLAVRDLIFQGLRKNEQIYLFKDHLKNPKNQPATFSFLKENLDRLKKFLSENQLGDLPYLAEGLCSEEDALLVSRLFEPHIHSFQGGPRKLLEVVEKINLCAAKKRRHAQADVREALLLSK